jgi:hypothetical protein
VKTGFQFEVSPEKENMTILVALRGLWKAGEKKNDRVNNTEMQCIYV